MSRHLITSALPYVNGVKHLGNLVGSMLPADVYARFLRMDGEEVLFICATDEHGTPSEISALEAGMDVADYCAKMHDVQKDIYRRFGLSFDHFGRSSSPENRLLTQHFYRKLDENGFIEERVTKQLYCYDDKRYLPDRYVIGTCPKCGYEMARGDQCEGCTSLLNPEDLLSPRSAISGSENLEMRETKHLFLRLDLLAPEVEKWVESHDDWPKLTKSIAMKWLNEGLLPRCITRDLTWGVPVPREGFEGKVFYVWFDAPIEYIGATQEWENAAESGDFLGGISPRKDWRSWWFDAHDVIYTQFMAKDNLPFHTITWPAVILGTREPWTLARFIKGFNWLTYCGGKFSTSQQRGVFTDKALDIYPADYWRYYLIAMAPESDDSDFSWPMFAATVKKDLAGNLGNFVNRTLKLTAARFGPEGGDGLSGSVPSGGSWGEREEQLQEDVRSAIDEFRGCMHDKQFRKSTLALKQLWSLGNLYIDERAPWALLKTDRDEAAMVLRTCINLARCFALVSSPLIPFTSRAILESLGLSDALGRATFDDAGDLQAVKAGSPFVVPPVLFQKIDDDAVERLTHQFGGTS